MTFSVLAIDPNYEDLTSAAYKYRSTNVYAMLNANNLSLVPLINSQADADPVSAAALKDGVVYITGVGHGEYDTFHGYFNHPVFSVADLNPSIVTGKIVHLLSCETANGLGPDMVALGCRAFFGYSVPFTYDPSFSSIFFACDAQIDFGLAAGHTAGKVAADVTAFFEKSINDNPGAAAYLRMNLDNFCSPANGTRWGQTDASLFNG
jgi:hypothetical protein